MTIDRIKVVATAAVTWLVAVSAVVVIVADELAKVLPTDAAEDVGVIALRIVAWLGAAVAIIRRVTPVLPEQRGILPADGPVRDARGRFVSQSAI